MIKKFQHKTKDFHVQIAVDGAGDPVLNRKGFVPLLKGKYMNSSVINPIIIERDFNAQ